MATQPARTHEGKLAVWLKKKLIVLFWLEIEAQILEIQAKKAALAQENGDDEENSEGISMSLSGGMDSEIYGDSRNRFRGYDTSIAAGDEAENEVSIITMHFIRFINDFFF